VSHFGKLEIYAGRHPEVDPEGYKIMPESIPKSSENVIETVPGCRPEVGTIETKIGQNEA
jgi:hypothetical protein